MKKLILLSSIALSLILVAPESRASTVCGSVAGNLISNCGFETGNFNSWTLTGNDVPGALGNLYGVEQQDPFPLPNGTNPNSGSFQAYFSDLDSNATILSQTFSTVASDTYSITFYLAQYLVGPGANPPANELMVSFAGQQLASLSGFSEQGYTMYTYTGTATSGTSTFSLTLGDDAGEFLLDDVSVVQNTSATPEPSSLLLLATGLAGAAGAARRRLRR